MKKMILVLSVFVIVLSLLTGCGKTEQEVFLAVVVGRHANAVEIPLNAMSIKEAVYNSCYTYGNVAFVSADGSPKVYYQADIPKPEVRGLSATKKQTIANTYTMQLLAEIGRAEPSVTEVDTLKAVQLAAQTLAGGTGTADKVMVIMDSGLSTTGYLDFTKDLLNADTKSVIEALKEAEAIPNLKDVSVVWMFQAQTAAPQKELSDKQKHKLQEIWREVLMAGGAENVEFTSDIASDVPEREYPAVSLVDVENRELDTVILDKNDNESTEEQSVNTIVLDGTSVRFVGNQAVFVDKELAVSNIQRLAEELLSHKENKVYVIGTTASGDADFCGQLSVDRAQAVVEVLVSLGVPESQLIPMGLGFEDPWHVDDLDINGTQIEEKACQNRKVLIIDVNGKDAEKISN